MTHYVQVVRDAKDFDADGWKPWYNCETMQQTACMAAHKFARDNGYINERNEPFEPITLRVYVATPDMPKHPNGRFMTCHGFDLKITPNG
jgi:hypothetical protein